jgi:hypothetical protein
MRTFLVAATIAGCAMGSTHLSAQTLEERAGARAVIARRGDAVVIVLGTLRSAPSSMAGGCKRGSGAAGQRDRARCEGATVMALSSLDPGN